MIAHHFDEQCKKPYFAICRNVTKHRDGGQRSKACGNWLRLVGATRAPRRRDWVGVYIGFIIVLGLVTALDEIPFGNLGDPDGHQSRSYAEQIYRYEMLIVNNESIMFFTLTVLALRCDNFYQNEFSMILLYEFPKITRKHSTPRPISVNFADQLVGRQQTCRWDGNWRLLINY